MSYKDLIAWKKGMQLVGAIYDATDSFPQHEIYGLTSQLRRAAVSIPSNIAEGQAIIRIASSFDSSVMREVGWQKLKRKY